MQETSLKTLIFRAVTVTAAVLLLLGLLRHFGILSVAEDPPAPDAAVVTWAGEGFLSFDL